MLPVWSLPLRIYRSNEKSGLDFPKEFSFDLFDANALRSLQEYYNPKRIAQHLDGMESSIYFVYVKVDP